MSMIDQSRPLSETYGDLIVGSIKSVPFVVFPVPFDFCVLVCIAISLSHRQSQRSCSFSLGSTQFVFVFWSRPFRNPKCPPSCSNHPVNPMWEHLIPFYFCSICLMNECFVKLIPLDCMLSESSGNVMNCVMTLIDSSFLSQSNRALQPTLDTNLIHWFWNVTAVYIRSCRLSFRWVVVSAETWTRMTIEYSSSTGFY